MENIKPLTNWELDELFVKEVGSVTKIVDKLPANDKIMLMCLRWFEVLQLASPEEKYERNFMLVLLHRQLNDHNTLKYPFTDARNLHKDLKTLCKIVQTDQTSKVSLDDDAYETACSVQSSSKESVQFVEHINSAKLEDVNQQLLDENALLYSQIQSMQAENKVVLERLQSCQTNLEILRNNDIMYDKELSYMKNIFGCTAIKALELIAKSNSTVEEQPKYISTLLNMLNEKQQVRVQLRQLDNQFWRLLRKTIKNRLRSSVIKAVSSEYDSVRDIVHQRYKEVSKDQKDSYMQDLFFKAMQYLKVLCQLFLDTYTGDKREKEAVVDFLQKHYKEMAQQI